MQEAADWFDNAPISAEAREKISWRSVVQLVRLVAYISSKTWYLPVIVLSKKKAAT
jgi:hypothetical protein